MTTRLLKLVLMFGLGLVLTASLTTAPAEAATLKGRLCKSKADVTRCAGFRSVSGHGFPPYVLAIVSATARDGARANVVKVQLQRVIDGRWRTIRARTPRNGYTSLESEYIQVKCGRLSKGVYRVRGRVKWISGGSVYSGWVKSHAMTKAALC